MNKVVLIGRLTKDPSYAAQQGGTGYARYSLAVEKPRKNGADNGADFISVVAFGKAAEFSAKYFHKGSKVAVSGHLTSGSYVNQQGIKIYTTDVVVEEQEFAETKAEAESRGQASADNTAPAAASQGAYQTPAAQGPAAQAAYQTPAVQGSAAQAAYQAPAQGPAQGYRTPSQTPTTPAYQASSRSAYQEPARYTPGPQTGGYIPAANPLPAPQQTPGAGYTPSGSFGSNELPFEN